MLWRRGGLTHLPPPCCFKFKWLTTSILVVFLYFLIWITERILSEIVRNNDKDTIRIVRSLHFFPSSSIAINSRGFSFGFLVSIPKAWWRVKIAGAYELIIWKLQVKVCFFVCYCRQGKIEYMRRRKELLKRRGS